MTKILIDKRIIDKLRKNIQSYMQDRKELTVLLLYFLTKHNPSFQSYLVANNITVLLYPFLQSNLQNLSLVGLKVIRKLCKENVKQIDQFLESINNVNGIFKMIGEEIDLDIAKSVLHLVDELVTVQGVKYVKGGQRLKEMGVVDKLQEIIERLQQRQDGQDG